MEALLWIALLILIIVLIVIYDYIIEPMIDTLHVIQSQLNLSSDDSIRIRNENIAKINIIERNIISLQQSIDDIINYKQHVNNKFNTISDDGIAYKRQITKTCDKINDKMNKLRNYIKHVQEGNITKRIKDLELLFNARAYCCSGNDDCLRIICKHFNNTQLILHDIDFMYNNGQRFNLYVTGNSYIEVIDLSGCNLNKYDWSNKFQNCINLRYVNLSNCNVKDVNCTSYMFDNCTSLEKVIITDWTFTTNCTTNQMFNKCNKLTCIDCTNKLYKLLQNNKLLPDDMIYDKNTQCIIKYELD